MTFDLTNLPPLSSLSPDKLRALQADLDELYAEVESQEPDEEESEEYDAWLDDLEEIEDLMEEVTEQLEG